MYMRKNVNFKWLQSIKKTLDECGLSNIWLTQNVLNIEWLKCKVKLCLTDQYNLDCKL